MNWIQLLTWVNDAARTEEELTAVIFALGLGAPAGGSPLDDFRNILHLYIEGPADLNAPVPAAAVPPGWVAAAAAPAAPATPAPPPAPVVGGAMGRWLLVTLGPLVVAAFLLFIWPGWAFGNPIWDEVDGGATTIVQLFCADGRVVQNASQCVQPGVPGARAPVVPPVRGQQPSRSTGVTATNCGPVTWGPAGPAPGTGTSDSAKQVTEAAQVMRVEGNSLQYLTVHKFCPGDDTPNGWILGSSQTEANGVRVSAGFLPNGVCVDYDPGVTKVTGNIAHTQVLNPRWSRSLLAGDGSAAGLKFTVYWTPCVFTDGFPVKVFGTTSAPSSTSAASCPASAQEVGARTNSNAANWTRHPTFSNGWIYAGPVIDGFNVPAGGKVDYDGGSAESGRVPRGSAFTYWCPK